MDCPSWEKEEEEETKYLERLFNKFDENGDGLMSKHEMGLFLSALRVQMTDQQTHALLNTADNDGDGCLDFKEFVIMYHVLCHNYVLLPSSEQHLKEAFVLFDENGDGFISADELGKVLISLGFAEGGCKLSCEKMIRSVDENGDGKVDFPEFKKMVLQGTLTVEVEVLEIRSSGFVIGGRILLDLGFFLKRSSQRGSYFVNFECYN